MSTQVLNRETFTFSRELEFFQERELTAQIGVSKYHWPFAIIKELIDNSLDACETSGVVPEITFKLHSDDSGDIITVSDSGPGIPADVVSKILDFKTRTSDKEAYRSPSRGAQGNALKTILAIPFILTGKQGRVVITSQGIKHDIRVTLDTIAQRPVIEHEQEEFVKSEGCAISVYTGINLSHYLSGFLQILSDFTLFNPHLTLHVEGIFGDEAKRCNDYRTNPSWQKWLPSYPTSPFWYKQEDFSRLVSAYIAKAREGGRDYTLREFVSQFKGLSSTRMQKAITDQIPGIRRLSDLVNGNGLAADKVALMLQAMKQESKPVPPEALGVIGEAHFKAALEGESTTELNYYCYKHKGDIPFVLEAAFLLDIGYSEPRYSYGLNFSPAFNDPFGGDTHFEAKYRKDVRYGWGISGLAREFKLQSRDAARLVLHVVHPALIFQDRGKTHISCDNTLRIEIGKAIGEVLKEHCATHNQQVKEIEAIEKQKREQEKTEKQHEITLREAVFAVMAEAADKASGGGKYPYKVRQLYYQVRPLIQKYTNKELDYSYFTPPLVTDYEEANGPLAGLIYDDRGTLHEPHNGAEIPLGTEDVAGYEIPEYEYDKILYIEKEGFNDILKAANIGQRYDMAIMSSKGYVCRAAKQLLHRASGKDITILVAHDADSYGYDIARTLEQETRTSKGLNIKIIDIGLKVDDALQMGLEKERVTLNRQLPAALIERLTDEEIEFLKQYRTELNAMTTDQLINWIESKLAENGLCSKVVPPDGVLSGTIRSNLDLGISERATRAVNEAIEKILGISLTDLSNTLDRRIERPSTENHRDDLSGYMVGCPVTHWTAWAERRAQKLEIEAVKEIDKLAEQLIRERINNPRDNNQEGDEDESPL